MNNTISPTTTATTYYQLSRAQLEPHFCDFRAHRALTEAARAARAARGETRNVTGWYGVAGGNGKVATCYVCGKSITSWATGWPITRTAMADILEHGHRHIRQQ